MLSPVWFYWQLFCCWLVGVALAKMFPSLWGSLLLSPSGCCILKSSQMCLYMLQAVFWLSPCTLSSLFAVHSPFGAMEGCQLTRVVWQQCRWKFSGLCLSVCPQNKKRQSIWSVFLSCAVCSGIFSYHSTNFYKACSSLCFRPVLHWRCWRVSAAAKRLSERRYLHQPQWRLCLCLCEWLEWGWLQ